MIHRCFLQLRGNTNGYDVERRKLKVPINARYIRINPSAWRNGICMRVEFYGSSLGECISISFVVINRRTLEDLLRSKCTGQKMFFNENFSVNYPNPDLVTFIEDIHNKKFPFLCILTSNQDLTLFPNFQKNIGRNIMAAEIYCSLKLEVSILEKRI